MPQSTPLHVTIQAYEHHEPALSYWLGFYGQLEGDRGTVEGGGTYRAEEILLKHAEDVVLRARLPNAVQLPAALLESAGEPAAFRAWPSIEDELNGLGDRIRAELLALREEGFRRLRTVEVRWSASADDGFLSSGLDLLGEVRLDLAGVSGPDTATVRLLAEFRATTEATLSFHGTTLSRRYALACRLRTRAAITLALDLDDFNLTLPEIELPQLKLRDLPPLAFPSAPDLRTFAAGFGRFGKDVHVDRYVWNPPDPQLVLQLAGKQLLVAVMKSGLSNADYDLTRDPTANLASLNGRILIGADPNAPEITINLQDLKVAHWSGGGVFDANISASGSIAVPGDSTRVGPLIIEWEPLTVKPEIAGVQIAGGGNMPAGAMLRASIEFPKVKLSLVDDPTTVLAFGGIVELTPTGTHVRELRLLEPYPWKLVEQGASLLYRGAHKVVQVLSQLKPQAGDLDKLKRLLEVIGKLAVAVAQAAVLVTKEIAGVVKSAVDLLAQAAMRVSAMVVELLKQLAKLLASAPASLPAVDIEIRVALDPFELRQVMITMHTDPAVVLDPIEVLGFTFAIDGSWRPALLIDFVTGPGAYLLAVGGDTQGALAKLSTDLWLKRPGADPAQPEAVDAVRDASKKDGERPDRPLLTVSAKWEKDNTPAIVVLAGLSRGKGVFFQRVKQPPATRTIPVPGGGTAKISVVEGSFELAPLESEIKVDVDFAKERVLPLLGMGEPGTDSGSDGFLQKLQNSIGQVVTVEKTLPATLSGRKATAGLVLNIKAAGVSTQATLTISFNLDTFEIELGASDTFPLKSRRIEEKALGLTWVVEQRRDEDRKTNAEVPMFTLAFKGTESGFTLNKNEARMEVRFDELSSDGEGVVLEVDEFYVGRGGLDLVAKVSDRAVRMNGLDVPFRFTSGGFVIRSDRITEATLAGRGQLPPDLVGEADCSIALAFAQGTSGIELQSGKVEIEKKGEPIVCHATRFTLTITDLDIGFVKDTGYHFYLLVTGSLRFTPKTGEFEDGLLQHLGDLEISLERAPLTKDPRVLMRHISFQKALNPKKTFPLFNIFTFELRGFGFHPASPKFEGNPPAVNISGQVQFVPIGDVMQPKIDFHGLWLAPPKKGESLPRIKADGLGVDLQLAGSVKVRGSVLAVDPQTRTVEGAELAPPGYNTYGFLGEGELEIPGWGSMQASMGFLEVEKTDDPGNRQKAFFLYLQKNKLAVEIPTPFWTFWLREVGYGVGYRYTLAGIKDAENARSTAQLIRILDDVSKRQGDLGRFSAWKADPGTNNFTLALRGAFQPYPAEKVYDEKREERAESPFFFDVVAALRSDFTFLMSARGWLGVNYAAFLKNADNLREKPGFRGYLYISAPRSELLARVVADPRGFIGVNWEAVKDKDSVLRKAVQSVEWSATLYIRPGLFHYELGWPDQLSVKLVDKPNFRVAVRGGMIFRAADDGLLWGYNIGADAFLRFEGRVGSSVGAAIHAELEAKFVARLLAYLSWRLQGSLVYGLVSLDARLTFAVEAWMRVDLGFHKFTLSIGFSFSVQFTAAVELAITTEGIGARVEARIAVQVFGCTLSIGVGFSFNDGQLEMARARVARFMALSITSEQPDAPPVFAAQTGDATIQKDAETASAVHNAPADPAPGLKPDIIRSPFGRDIKPTNFWLVLREAKIAPPNLAMQPGVRYAYALLVPREAVNTNQGGFYAAPSQWVDEQPWRRAEDQPVHRIKVNDTFEGLHIWQPGAQASPGRFAAFTGNADITARWNAPIRVDGPSEVTFTLAHYFDECFLADTTWQFDESNKPQRITCRWAEPEGLRVHITPEMPTGASREERELERDAMQKAQRAHAIENPHDDRAFQARSTILMLFLDQFVALSEAGKRTDIPEAPIGAAAEVPDAHVTDLGLVFFGPVEELLKLRHAAIFKCDESELSPGSVEVLNPPETWFDCVDPTLIDAPAAIEPDGVKLNWRLEHGVGNTIDPEHFLHHYEIHRTVEGKEFTVDGKQSKPPIMRVKAAATIGATTKEGVTLLAGDWQLADTLGEDTGISAATRRALLPSASEADIIKAAEAWFTEFGGRTEVTLTYSVTPIDIAGVRGLPRSFKLNVPQPRIPVRPALGEIRVVQTLSVDRPGAEKETAGREDELDVYLALADSAWDDENLPGSKEAGFTVERIYRLIVDPDDLEPAGHYGSDAATERVRGPGAWSPQHSADELAFEIERKDTTDARTFSEIRALEPEDSERAKLTRWARLTKKRTSSQQLEQTLVYSEGAKTAFPLQVLWQRRQSSPPVRVATRFFLETLVRFTVGGKPPTDFVSQRVALPVEHVVITGANDPGIATLRPEAFEWAVPLVFPALAMGQVHAESGFARFRSPRPNARLGDLGTPSGHALVRDPERRVLTTVRFAAVPDWAGGFGSQGYERLHGTSIAGYDLHELDIDDLAALDSASDVFQKNAAIWRHARRVARIERVSADAARLIPTGNADWQGWQAHYPSETRRLELARLLDRGRDSKPIRAPWYSDRETTAHFPERTPRLRLLPLPPEGVIAELMRGGCPTCITAWLVAENGSTMAATDVAVTKGTVAEGDKLRVGLRLPRLMLHRTSVGLNHPTSVPQDVAAAFDQGPDDADPSMQRFSRRDGKPLSPAGVRNILLCLGWDSFDMTGEENGGIYGDYLKKWQENPTAFDGLTLMLSAEGKFGYAYPEAVREQLGDRARAKLISTGSAKIPLDLRSPLHPVLEEALAELTLTLRATEDDSLSTYRQYTVMTQPAPAVEARDLAGFIAATGPGPDPYGWNALQAMGLAATVRLYDAALDEFAAPSVLTKRVNEVLQSVRARWQLIYGPAYDEIIGQPFVEVHLKPGGDRLAGPFEAVIDGDLESEKAGEFEIDDAGLAFVQISLRPRPVAAWRYAALELGWKAAETQPPSTQDHYIKSISLEVTRRDGCDVDIDVARAQGANIARLTKLSPSVILPLPSRAVLPRSSIAQDQDLDLYVRLPGSSARPQFQRELRDDLLEVKLLIEWENIEVAEGKTKVTREYWKRSLEQIDCPVNIYRAWTEIVEPGERRPDPFERFAALSTDDWGIAFGRPLTPQEVGQISAKPVREATDALQSLRRTLAAAKPQDFEFPEPDAYTTIVGAYLNWLQRFLEHCAPRPIEEEPGRSDADASSLSPFLALAAPIKATPWKLAADAEGFMTLQFLHADRWAHARAYAVKPLARYHHVLDSVGIKAQSGAEALVRGDTLDDPIGYAVAVSPRTEKIEAPVILGSSLARLPDASHAIQIVVARHGEESLAASNRPLMARLGVPTTLLAFSRAYRTPQWTDRLQRKYSEIPIPKHLPTRDPKVPARPDDGHQITGTVVAEVAKDYPSLWKGADIWRVAPIPPHYRLIALASVRAGVVVSNISSVVQDDLPRKALEGRATELFPGTRVTFERDPGGPARLVLTHPLISHAQLTPDNASDWLKDGEQGRELDDLDVALWPDPDVLYVLSRRHRDESTQSEEEDAEIRLVATNDPDPGSTALPQPVVVRARGARYEAAAENGRPVVSTELPGTTRRFMLQTSYVRRLGKGAAAEIDSIRLRAAADMPSGKDEWGEEGAIRAFNADAASFAAILTPHTLTLSLPERPGETGAAYVARLRELPDALAKGTAGVAIDNAEWRTMLVAHLVRLNLACQAWLVDNADALVNAGKSAADIEKAASEALTIQTAWKPGEPLPPIDSSEAPLGMHASLEPHAPQQDSAVFLVVWDIASDAELTALMAVGMPPVAQLGGRLHERLARRVLGGMQSFQIRAVDARNSTTLSLTNPGVVETEVTLPKWLEGALQTPGERP